MLEETTFKINESFEPEVEYYGKSIICRNLLNIAGVGKKGLESIVFFSGSNQPDDIAQRLQELLIFIWEEGKPVASMRRIQSILPEKYQEDFAQAIGAISIELAKYKDIGDFVFHLAGDDNQ